ncbi:hypothetical protein [Pontibacter ruber]|uniref:STAS/SEC14 domain-containing protein n=1 Tax=Pontibacter ruber TaxID=1343895 RepID=A0ABW5CWA6_9BACT|nr:hypothetical protein [Pontibacter ruber]
MILYEDGFLKLDYDATTDILYVPCPNIQEHDLLLVHKALSIVVEVMVSYDIKKFLFDSSKSLVDVSAEDYLKILGQLALGLTNSRLQKLARLVSADAMRENRIERFLLDTKVQLPLPYTIQNFSSRAVAVDWLLSK